MAKNNNKGQNFVVSRYRKAGTNLVEGSELGACNGGELEALLTKTLRKLNKWVVEWTTEDFS